MIANKVWAELDVQTFYANWDETEIIDNDKNKNNQERPNRNALVVCEKRQEWTTGLLSEALENVTQVVNKLNDQVAMLNTAFPYGFVYIQLPNQSEPRDLWPQTNWSDVTQNNSELILGSKLMNSIQPKDENKAHYQPRDVKTGGVGLPHPTPNSAIDLNICGDWIAYRKQKCIKILPIRGTYNEAIVNCQQDNANVITINDQDEQEFMMDILQEFNTTADRAWANHPTDSAYANWEDIPDTKYYRNRNEIPIHISLSGINYGKWYDERLSRKALIGCEKRQEWTVGLLSAALESVVKVVNQLNEQVKMGHTRVIPEGFVYIQLNNQSEPRDLWPWANWTDVTPDMSELLMDSNQLNGIQVKDENRAESQAVKVWKRIFPVSSVNAMIETPNHRLIILAVSVKYSSKDIFSDVSYTVVGSIVIAGSIVCPLLDSYITLVVARLITLAVSVKYSSKDIFSDVSYTVVGSIVIAGSIVCPLLDSYITLVVASQQNTIDKQQEIQENLIDNVNTVPICFIYIQLPNHSEPIHLCPVANWSDATIESNLLFKVHLLLTLAIYGVRLQLLLRQLQLDMK
ncbi:unnamed protein product [Oppiella nova]|uniref:C-type lectin domain-containing protein n=1 Tax=Oppiella nova TaxID=334625 RepID=A0A7R9LVC7_9ACAR|nr:unnamed protein product [Oppiella nova]CAG2167315.1 unnamed protein product [Oppiella nova]